VDFACFHGYVVGITSGHLCLVVFLLQIILYSLLINYFSRYAVCNVHLSRTSCCLVHNSSSQYARDTWLDDVKDTWEYTCPLKVRVKGYCPARDKQRDIRSRNFHFSASGIPKMYHVILILCRERRIWLHNGGWPVAVKWEARSWISPIYIFNSSLPFIRYLVGGNDVTIARSATVTWH